MLLGGMSFFDDIRKQLVELEILLHHAIERQRQYKHQLLARNPISFEFINIWMLQQRTRLHARRT
jgi:hypothetical protein